MPAISIGSNSPSSIIWLAIVATRPWVKNSSPSWQYMIGYAFSLLYAGGTKTFSVRSSERNVLVKVCASILRCGCEFELTCRVMCVSSHVKVHFVCVAKVLSAVVRGHLFEFCYIHNTPLLYN